MRGYAGEWGWELVPERRRMMVKIIGHLGERVDEGTAALSKGRGEEQRPPEQFLGRTAAEGAIVEINNSSLCWRK